MTRRVISRCLISLLLLTACGGTGGRSQVPGEPTSQVLIRPEPPFVNLDPGNPKVSPDGRLVAFLGDFETPDTLWPALGVLQPDGRVTMVTDDEDYPLSYAWMPDSHSLVAASDRSGGSFSANAFGIWTSDGQFIRVITPQVGLWVEEGMSVAADGAVAIVAATPPPSGAGFGLLSDLYVVDLTTGDVEQVTHTPDEDEQAPQFLGSDRVFFVKSTGRENWGRGYVLDLETRRLQAVTPASEGVVDATAKGGLDLVVYSTARPGSLVDNEPCFRSISLSGTQERELFCRDARYPDLSPDGTWLVVKDIGAFVPPTDPRQIQPGGSIVRIALSG